MNISLKDHPFDVAAFFESSLVLTYAVPVAELKGMIPPCLELDVFEDQWAFIAIAVVKTKHLRPKGFPVWMGNDFVLTGYRIFVRYTTNQGKRLRGLYILGSETDKYKMQLLGNIFTHYNYKTTNIRLSEEEGIVKVKSDKLDIAVSMDNASLPESSPFKDWKEARRYAGPLPFTFTYKEASKEVLIIEGVRESWIPAPVKVIKSEAAFIDQFKGARLANAFIIKNIPYYWKKGKTDIWKG
jgi:uncharacterized protein YqjF (DUF2071 family)